MTALAEIDRRRFGRPDWRQARLVVAGNLTLDDTVNPNGTVEASPGGDALYTAVGAAMWGGTVDLLTVAGADYPAAYLDRIAALGVGVERVRRDPGPTVHYRIEDAPDGTRTYTHLTAEDRLEATSPNGADFAAALRDAAWLHLAAMPVEPQRAGVQAARRADVTVSLDPHEEYVVPEQATLLPLVAGSVFMPSELEIELLFPALADAVADPVERAGAALEAIARWSPELVAIKLGARGSLVGVPGGKPTLVAALAVDVVDAIGAGDAYAGGFAAGFLATGSAVAAAACGAVSAARVIGQFGAFPAEWPPDPAELVAAARSLVAFDREADEALRSILGEADAPRPLDAPATLARPVGA